ncbi:hypothetical protein M514_05803 [Trichuris suis]|uniref:DUF7041 domain-containing protein n=1 Tax=Trichuris suis TaxID=68888 RepID=A0A085NAB6_9BILA|nr:hypothetical protein M513_05803 [Trichuris suis]KFD66412.1 hypothetical protein M514_05803 [Trichuris suis]
MPVLPGTTPPSTLTTISTSTISVPKLSAADPELRFARLDLFLAQQDISDEVTKLQLAFTSISDDVLASFRDFISAAKGKTKQFTLSGNFALNAWLTTRNGAFIKLCTRHS